MPTAVNASAHNTYGTASQLQRRPSTARQSTTFSRRRELDVQRVAIEGAVPSQSSPAGRVDVDRVGLPGGDRLRRGSARSSPVSRLLRFALAVGRELACRWRRRARGRAARTRSGYETLISTSSAVQPVGAVNSYQLWLSPAARQPSLVATRSRRRPGSPRSRSRRRRCRRASTTIGSHANGELDDGDTHVFVGPSQTCPFGHACSGPHRYEPLPISGLHAASADAKNQRAHQKLHAPPRTAPPGAGAIVGNAFA